MVFVYAKYGFTTTIILINEIKKTLLSDSISRLEEIRSAHKRNLIESRRNKNKQQPLSDLVNPALQKMTERQHATIVTKDGPRSSPLLPPEDYEQNSDSDDEPSQTAI